MTKPNDSTTPAGQEPESTTGTQEMSWQSAMDSPVESPDTVAAPKESSDSVDFVLGETPPPVSDEMEKKGGSAFGEKAGDADALWASLAKKDPAPAEDADEAARAEGGEYGFGSADDAPPAEDAPGTDTPAAAMGKAKKQPAKRAPATGPFGGKSFGPVILSQPMMKDEDGELVPTPPTIASRLFTVLALIPILLPVALFLAQVVFTLDVRALWYSDEVRYAAAYQSMVNSADWLVMHLNGVVYPDKPPLFFWFLYGLDEAAKAVMPLLPFAFTVTENMIFFAGVAISGLLCLLATHALASFVGRVDRRTVLAADLILLSGFFFAGLTHYLRMDLLFTAFITISHVFLFHAYVRDRGLLLMVLGWAFAGAAVLVKGPLGIAFPLLAVLFFLLWQGRLLRFFRVNSLLGLIIGLAVPGTWLALAWMNLGDPFLREILDRQIADRALNTWHHAESWFHYLWTFPLIWLPWTLIFLFLPWGRFMGKGMREGLRVSRTRDGAGIAYLWCAFLPGFVLLSLVSIKIPIYCLPLFPPLAVLCARAALRMRPFASSCLQYTLAILLTLLGLALVLMPALPGNMLPLPYVPRGVMVLGGICLFFACALAFLLRSRRTEGSILALALFTTAFAYPLWTATAPSLDAFLSPRAQAEVIKSYRAEGYFSATYKVYSGIYAYYAGTMPECETWEDALAQAKKHPKSILATRASVWDNLKEKPEGFAEVNRQIIAERTYVLVAQPPLGGQTPPPESVKTESSASEPTAPETPAADAAPPVELQAAPEAAPEAAPATAPEPAPAAAPADAPQG